MGFTSELARHSQTIGSNSIEEPVAAVAEQCILDWMGVALAGVDEAPAVYLRTLVQQDRARPVSTLIGSRTGTSVRQAALSNGTSGHALDYDDVNLALQGHATAVVLPAAFAVAEGEGASGIDFVRAFVAGYEATCILGQYMGRSHYAKGFHSTATLGCVGAAVASSILLKLPLDGIVRAIGIAGTQASGLKAQFGTMSKPLHAGKASESGVLAAYLARCGVTSREDLLEARQGFAAAMDGEGDAERAFALPQRGAHIFDNIFKFNASCLGTQGTIEALRQLQDTHGITANQVTRIEIDVERGADSMCNITKPTSGMEMQFSLRFAAALVLAQEDTTVPATFCDANARRQDLQSLASKVHVQLMPASWPLLLTTVRVFMEDGRVFANSVDLGRPCLDVAAQKTRLLDKFGRLTSSHLTVAQVRSLAAMVFGVSACERPLSLLAYANAEALDRPRIH